MEKATVDSWAQEIVMHSWLGQWAWHGLHKLTRRNAGPGIVPSAGSSRENVTAILSHMSETWGRAWLMVSAGAVISRILWPERKDLAKRGAELCSALDLPPTPQIQNRRVRDQLEHIEQSLPGWARRTAKSSPSGPYASWSYGTEPEMSTMSGVPANMFFRYLDTKAWQLRVGTASIDLKELAVDFHTLSGAIRVKHTWTIGTPQSVRPDYVQRSR